MGTCSEILRKLLILLFVLVNINEMLAGTKVGLPTFLGPLALSELLSIQAWFARSAQALNRSAWKSYTMAKTRTISLLMRPSLMSSTLTSSGKKSYFSSHLRSAYHVKPTGIRSGILALTRVWQCSGKEGIKEGQKEGSWWEDLLFHSSCALTLINIIFALLSLPFHRKEGMWRGFWWH